MTDQQATESESSMLERRSSTRENDPKRAELEPPHLHHLAVLRKYRMAQKPRGRGASAVLAKRDVQTAFARSPSAGGGGDDVTHKKRYEEMMSRFQIRRLQSTEARKPDMFGSQRKLLRQGSKSAIFAFGRREPLQSPSLAAQSVAMKARPRPSVGRASSKYGSQLGGLVDTRATVIDMSNAAATTSAQSAVDSLASRGEADAPTTMREKLERLYEDGTSWRWVVLAWKRRAVSKWRRFLRRLQQPMSPLSPLFRVRMAVLGSALFACVVAFPVHLAFREAEQQWTHTVDYTVEFIGLADFVLMFNTSFINAQKELVTSRRAIASQYMTGWGLLDIFSSVPIHAGMNYFSGTQVRWTNPSVIVVDVVPRVARIAHFVVIMQFLWDARPNRTGKSMWDWLLYSRYSHLLRIGLVVCCILMTAHYMACIWKTLAYADASAHGQSFHHIYAASFFDALQLLQGQGVATASLEQNAFASVAVLVGSIVLAIIFGHVAVLVANFNANSTNYQRQMESVFAVMTKMQLPTPLRERIHQYYEHLWREYESLDSEVGRFSKGLSHTLELEVVLFKYMELIMHVPFWTSCSLDFQKQLALNLHIRVYLPDDFIMRRGEIGDEFYMINHGSVELEVASDTIERATGPLRKKNTSCLSDFADFMGATLHPPAKANGSSSEDDDDDDNSDSDGEDYREKPRKSRAKRSIYRTENFDADDDEASPRRRTHASKGIKKLSRGQAFGEVALLVNYPRTANVRAITYVEMCVLSRSAFHQNLARHPEDRNRVVLRMLTNAMERNESNDVPCPLMEVVRDVYDDTDGAITPADAAELITRILVMELEDTSIRYGITSKLMEQLVEYRDRVVKKTSSEPTWTPVSVSDPNLRQNSDAGLVQRRSSIQSSSDDGGRPQVSPVLLTRIESIEETQEQLMRCLVEMRGFIADMQEARLAALAAEAAVRVE